MSNAGPDFQRKTPETYGKGGWSTNKSGVTSEELSAGDIEELDLDSDDIVIEELGANPKLRQRKPDEKPVKVNLDRLDGKRRLEKFFLPEELEAMREARDLVEGRKSSVGSAKEAWDGIREDVNRHNEQVREYRKEKQIAELKQWAKENDPLYNKDVSSLSGAEFVQLLQEGMSDSDTTDEELQAKIEELERAYEPEEPEVPEQLEAEEAELASEAWSERGGVWAEFAEDIKESQRFDDTTFETIGPHSKRVHTHNEKMKEELREAANEEAVDGKTVEIESDTGDTVIATISKE